MNRSGLRFLARARAIDRRWVALSTVLVLLLPMLVRMPLTIVPFPATVELKKTIDAVPRDKLIAIAVDWDSGTKGECQPLTNAIIDYLFKTDRKFALFGFIPQGPELAQDQTKELAAKYGKQYGQDWVNWGYRPQYVTTLMAMMNGIAPTLKKDIEDRDLTQDPITAMAPTLKDVGLLYEVTGTNISGVYLQYCAGVPLAFGCTAVQGPDMYPYLQSGQAKGLLVGLGGAAQFETVGDFRDPQGNRGGQGTRGMGSQSLGHLLVMLLIVLGNLGVWAQRKLDSRPAPPVEPATNEGDQP